MIRFCLLLTQLPLNSDPFFAAVQQFSELAAQLNMTNVVQQQIYDRSCPVAHSWCWDPLTELKKSVKKKPNYYKVHLVIIYDRNCVISHTWVALSAGSRQFKGNTQSFCKTCPMLPTEEVGWGALPYVQVKQERASQPLFKRHLSRGRLFIQSAITAGNAVA